MEGSLGSMRRYPNLGSPRWPFLGTSSPHATPVPCLHLNLLQLLYAGAWTSVQQIVPVDQSSHVQCIGQLQEWPSSSRKA